MTDILVAVICAILVGLFIIVMYEWKLIIRKRKLDIWKVELDLLDAMALALTEGVNEALLKDDFNALFAKEISTYIQSASFTAPIQLINLHLKKYFR